MHVATLNEFVHLGIDRDSVAVYTERTVIRGDGLHTAVTADIDTTSVSVRYE